MSFNPPDYYKIKKEIMKWKKEKPKFYYSDNEKYIELHANHTAWKCNCPESRFGFLVEDVVKQFEEETGVKIYGLGRSGRHVCVKDTPKNREDYAYLKHTALELEKDVIKECQEKEI